MSVSQISRKRIHDAFTLVELLVVIAIIGVLVALLLPAVQAAREAARRIQCQNNVRNLALGVLNYENARGVMPPSSQMLGAKTRLPGVTSPRLQMYTSQARERLSWIYQILPNIEQQALYDQFDPNLTVFNQDVNSRPEEAQPAVLLCPSDDTTGTFYEQSNRRLAKGNYAAYASPEHATSSTIWPGALIQEPQPLQRFTDGTSSTVMLAEVLTREEPTDQRGAWAVAYIGSSILALDLHGQGVGTGNIAEQGRQVPYYPVVSGLQLQDALTPNLQTGSLTADEILQCENTADADLQRMPCRTHGSTQNYTAAPRSNHTGGVNAANVDGSVRFLSDDIEPPVLGVLIHISDGLLQDSIPVISGNL